MAYYAPPPAGNTPLEFVPPPAADPGLALLSDLSVAVGDGAPAFTPTTSVCLYFDRTDKAMWTWFNGSWNT